MEKGERSEFFLSAVKGVGLAVISMLFGVLVFAFIVKLTAISSGAIKAVNQFIKITSVFLGCFFTLKGKAGLVKGVIVGLLSTVIIYLIFALLGGEGVFGTGFILDILFGTAIGAVSGIIAVNTRGKE